MYVRLLGTAAGGGFPQWNCNCTNCQGVRSGTLQARPRTQSCVAISADKIRWFLLNVSPDIHRQIEAFSPLTPPADSSRGSGIAAILLTDADLDHSLGLFLLREGFQQTIYATATVRHALTEGLTLSPVLSHYCGIEWREASLTWTPLCYADRSLELPRIWGVGEEKCGILKPGGFDGQNTADLHERIQATSCSAI